MDKVSIIRHMISTIKYRSSKAILDIPNNYPNFELGNGVRTPIEILRHMSAVIRYAQSVFDFQIQKMEDQENWNDEVNIFFNELKYLDNLLKSNGIPNKELIVEKLIQGPLSDVLTHVGQLSMIRRIVGEPITSENFFEAEINVE